MSEAEQDEIREAFDKCLCKYRYGLSDFARNEFRYFDSVVELAWQAFQAGFKFEKGEE